MKPGDFHTKSSRASEYTLEDGDVRKIINATSTLRDKLIIEILCYTGCRKTELILLRFIDINFELDMIDMPTVKQEKKSKKHRELVAYENTRRIPIINDDLKRDLQAYMELLKAKRHITPTSRLIQSREKESICKEMINHIVRKSAEKACIKSPNPNRKHVHPHMFRHTFVRYARKHGVDYKVIQEIVGHKSIATTMDMYGHPTWGDMKSEFQKMKDFGMIK